MSERWKCQIRIGLYWAIAIIVWNKLINENEKSFVEEIATLQFWLKFSVLLPFTILVIGYLFWKQKQKGSDFTWSDIFRKKAK